VDIKPVFVFIEPSTLNIAKTLRTLPEEMVAHSFSAVYRIEQSQRARSLDVLKEAATRLK